MNATVTPPTRPATVANLCPCGKPAAHLTAAEDGPDWACRVRDPRDDSRVDSTLCSDCRWVGGKHDPRVIHLPAEVEDHELDVWVREPGTADTYRLRVTEWSQHVSTSDHVLTLGELRRAYGPLHVAGSSL